MNIFSVIIAGLLGLLLITFTVLLVVAIAFNVKTGIRYRQALATKLDKLRLGKMLAALGVDTNAYLHTENIVEIQKQMNRCSECSNTERCDEELAGNSVDAGSIEFCNNEESLKEMLDSGKSATSVNQ